MPEGSSRVTLAHVSDHGVPDSGPDIFASTSIEAIREHVIAHAVATGQKYRPSGFDPCTQYSSWDACWTRVHDDRGRLLIAVITNYECNARDKEAAAITGRTLYFVHWVGGNAGWQPVAGCALATPEWRLYAASRADLPARGPFTVKLELRGLQLGTFDSIVDLA